MSYQKYGSCAAPTNAEQRLALNRKVIDIINCGGVDGITNEDIFNAYTGDGGLHGLERKDYENYHEYSEAKKEIENGQFFTPPNLCRLVIEALAPSQYDLVADLTCGKGGFFNFLPAEENAYGCEIDTKAYKVARHLFPAANLTQGDIRHYKPGVRFDYVVGNPPFNLRWYVGEDDYLSQLYYCIKAAQLLKPLGILALIVPQSFLADDFLDKKMVKQMEERFSFLGQIGLPDNAFAALGVEKFQTKLQLWQKIGEAPGWEAHRYTTELLYSISLLDEDTVSSEAKKLNERVLLLPKADLEKNKSHILLELAREHAASKGFAYETQKLLYQIKAHPATRERYMKCCEYVHRFYTQEKPEGMDEKEWSRAKLTEKKVLAYLKRALAQQAKKPERDVIRLVKQNDQLVYKAYSKKAKLGMSDYMRTPTQIYDAVLEDEPEKYPGFERFLRRKRQEYDRQSQPFCDMKEDAGIAEFLRSLILWDAENEMSIQLNDLQRHDVNLILQKRYGMLQWEQGSGKTLAAIAVGAYRMLHQQVHTTWVVSTAISIRNNWNVVLKNYSLPFTFVERLSDLDKIRSGSFVILTLNKLSSYQARIKKWIRAHHQNIQLVLDESDEISNPNTVRAKAALSCFRCCRYKLLTTGTSTRNNISEFAPQLELLYNNSINMISWCQNLYSYDKDDEEGQRLECDSNDYYGKPIPAYKRGYSLFSRSHLPERTTVFGIGLRTQDIFNAEELNEILAKTVITRTFEEVSGKDIRRLHQVPLHFSEDELDAYDVVCREFQRIQRNYFGSTGNSRKDAMLRLMQQITLLLRVSAAPSTLKEYTGGTPVKVMAAVDMAAQWPDEPVVIGIRHKTVLDVYVEAFKEYLPDRPLFVVTGQTITFAQRRKLRRTLRESGNGILLCTQQSLPSSVNFEFVNKVIIPELHYNNASMSQFYMRFVRYNSTQYKDIYFLTYAGSLESNLMQMVLVKEKINLFMKGQDTDLDEIYEKFGVDFDLFSLMMRREEDEKGKFHIRWGEQKIA